VESSKYEERHPQQKGREARGEGKKKIKTKLGSHGLQDNWICLNLGRLHQGDSSEALGAGESVQGAEGK